MRAPAARADPPLNDLAAIRPHEMRAAAAAFAALRMVLITRLALRLLCSGDGRRRCWRGPRRRRRGGGGGRGGRGQRGRRGGDDGPGGGRRRRRGSARPAGGKGGGGSCRAE